MRRCFLTGCYTGLIPKAPGTWGSLFGLAVGALLLHFLPQSSLFLLAILITIVAIKEINIYEAATNTHDASYIVIDEIAGMWLAMAILPNTAPLWLILAFVFFRFYDISKISYIGKLEKLPGGLGVMADDLLAGVLAGLSTGVLYAGYTMLQTYL